MKPSKITLVLATVLVLGLFSFSYSQNQNADTLLLIGAISGNIDMARNAMSQGASANSYNMQGVTPLMISCLTGNYDIVELLIENGADINAKNDDGQTALILAMTKSNYDISKLLIYCGADVDASDKSGMSVEKLSNLFRDTDIPQLIQQARSGVLKPLVQKNAAPRRNNNTGMLGTKTIEVPAFDENKDAIVQSVINEVNARDNKRSFNSLSESGFNFGSKKTDNTKTKNISKPSDENQGTVIVTKVPCMTQEDIKAYVKPIVDAENARQDGNIRAARTVKSNQSQEPSKRKVIAQNYTMSDRVEMSTFKGEFKNVRFEGKQVMAFMSNDGIKYYIASIKTSNRLRGNRSDESFDEGSLVNGKKYKVDGYIIPTPVEEMALDIRNFEEIN